MAIKSAGDRGHRYGKCGGHVPRVRYAHVYRHGLPRLGYIYGLWCENFFILNVAV